MKAGVYYKNSDVRVEERPMPTAGNDGIVLKIWASGICGSDLLEWYRIKKAPLVLGHEITGEVIEVGSLVKDFKLGDRVFATHHVPCDACHYCLSGHTTACETFHTKNNFEPGGFAEYLRVSGRSLASGTFKLPAELSYEEGSFIEPLATVVRGLRAADIKPGDSILIIGSGMAGLLAIKLARTLGAGRIIAADISESRLEAAKKYGADAVVDAKGNIPEAVKKVNNGRLADKVLLSAGALPAAVQALQSADRGGTIIFFAVPKPRESVPVDFNPFWRNDIVIKTSYGATPLDNMQALELLRNRRVVVSDLVTHRFGIDDIGEAFRVAASGDCLKVLITPHGSATK
jgi:L-iditol 2-dehydrogenase